MVQSRRRGNWYVYEIIVYGFMSRVYIISGAKRNSYGENPLFGGSATYMWREAPKNGHNFDM